MPYLPEPHMTDMDDNVLVVELRSLTAAALTAATAAERGDWAEAHTCISDVVSRAKAVERRILSTEHELRGHGDTRLSSSTDR